MGPRSGGFFVELADGQHGIDAFPQILLLQVIMSIFWVFQLIYRGAFLFRLPTCMERRADNSWGAIILLYCSFNG